MPAKDTPAKPERPTLTGQLARQHELLMAAATRPSRVNPETIEIAERHTGSRDGELRLVTLALVREDGESSVQFLGRLEETTRDVMTVLDTLNAERAKPAPAKQGETK